jgi:glucose-1-phosphate thymidylyltransferase
VAAGEVVGLVPAAGRATRLGVLPCSKEIYPLGFTTPPHRGGRVRVACDDLLTAMARAGAERAFVVLRSGKWDIPAFLGAGGGMHPRLAYVPLPDSPSTLHTVDAALPFVGDAQVLFGFPDIPFTPLDAFARLLARQDASGDDVVLGLFPAPRPHKVDMVEVDPVSGAVRALVIKPARTALRHAWILALWGRAFSAFVHDDVRAAGAGRDGGAAAGERFVGHALQAALEAGLRIGGVTLDDGRFRDIGTPDELPAAPP